MSETTYVLDSEKNKKRADQGHRPGCRPHVVKDDETGEVVDSGFVCYSFYHEPREGEES